MVADVEPEPAPTPVTRAVTRTSVLRAPVLDGGVGDLSGLRALDHDARTLYHHCSVAPLSSTRAPAYRRAVAVNIAGLPFLHPLNIERRGESSYDASRQATRALLRRPRAVDNEARGRVQYLRARARL